MSIGESGPFEEGARPLLKTGELQEKRFNKRRSRLAERDLQSPW
jgi:hypothetical protein